MGTPERQQTEQQQQDDEIDDDDVRVHKIINHRKGFLIYYMVLISIYSILL